MVGYVVFQGDVFDSATYDGYKPLAGKVNTKRTQEFMGIEIY